MPSSNTLIYGLSIVTAGIIGYASMYVANNIFPITGGNVSKPEPQSEPQPEPQPEPKVSATAPQIESIPEEKDFAGGGESVENSTDEEDLLKSRKITITANTSINPHSGGGFSFPNSLNNTTPIAYNQPLTNGLTYHF